MTDKLEEVARAIGQEFYGTAWDKTSLFRQVICLKLANTAIEAMRTMTPEMRAVLEYQLDRQGHDQTLEATWNILIDAALAPADGGEG